VAVRVARPLGRLQRAGEKVTTLGFNRGVCIAVGIVCYAFAIGVPVGAIALSLHVASKSHAELYAVIPIGVVYAAGIALLGSKIVRTRVTVTPTTLTSYTFQSRLIRFRVGHLWCRRQSTRSRTYR
jgi:hypothetical protein